MGRFGQIQDAMLNMVGKGVRTPKATPEQVEKLARMFIASASGGQWSKQMPTLPKPLSDQVNARVNEIMKSDGPPSPSMSGTVSR